MLLLLILHYLSEYIELGNSHIIRTIIKLSPILISACGNGIITKFDQEFLLFRPITYSPIEQSVVRSIGERKDIKTLSIGFSLRNLEINFYNFKNTSTRN